MPIKGNVLKNHSYDHVLSSTKNSIISGLRPDNPIKANVLKNHSYKNTLNDTSFGEAVSDTVDAVDSAIDSVDSVLGEGSSNTFWGSLGGLVNRLVNTGWDDWTGNTANRENIAFQKEYNDTVFQRADTQYQRTVADLRASGLSSQLAAGSPSTVAGTTAAPQRSVGNESVAMERLVGLINAIKSTNASTKLAEAQAANVGADAALKKKDLETYDQRVGVDLALKASQSRYSNAMTEIAQIDGEHKADYWNAQINDIRKTTEYRNSLIKLCQKDQSLRDAQIVGEYQSHEESRERVKEIQQRVKNLKVEFSNLQADFNKKLSEKTRIDAETALLLKQASKAAIETDIQSYNLQFSQKYNLRTTDTQSTFSGLGFKLDNLQTWGGNFENIYEKYLGSGSSLPSLGGGFAW